MVWDNPKFLVTVAKYLVSITIIIRLDLGLKYKILINYQSNKESNVIIAVPKKRSEVFSQYCFKMENKSFAENMEEAIKKLEAAIFQAKRVEHDIAIIFIETCGHQRSNSKTTSGKQFD